MNIITGYTGLSLRLFFYRENQHIVCVTYCIWDNVNNARLIHRNGPSRGPIWRSRSPEGGDPVHTRHWFNVKQPQATKMNRRTSDPPKNASWGVM